MIRVLFAAVPLSAGITSALRAAANAGLTQRSSLVTAVLLLRR